MLHGCDPLSFSSAIWGSWRVWTIDRDRRLSTQRLKQLIDSIEIDFEKLESMFLFTTLQQTISKPLPKSGSWPWLIPYGIRNRTNLIGLNYCPRCFLSDEVPYFRKSWRLSWVTSCTKHKRRLINKCQVCHNPIQPQKLKATSKFLNICPICNNNLSEGKSSKPQQGEVLFQEYLTDNLLKNKSSKQPKENFAIETFELAKFLLSILISARKSRGNMLRRLLSNYNIEVDALRHPTSTSFNFDSMTNEEKSPLMSSAFDILKLGIDTFIDQCIKSEVTQEALFQSHKELPTQLQEKLEKLKSISRPSYKRTSSYKHTLKPSKERIQLTHNQMLKKAITQYKVPNSER